MVSKKILKYLILAIILILLIVLFININKKEISVENNKTTEIKNNNLTQVLKKEYINLENYDKKCLSLAKEDIKYCGNDKRCQYEFYEHNAIFTQNSDLINMIDDTTIKIMVNATYFKDESNCDKIKNDDLLKNYCYTFVKVIKEQNEMYCSELKNLDTIQELDQDCKNTYYFYQARINKDLNSCDKISDDYITLKLKCKGLISKNISNCINKYEEEIDELNSNVEEFCANNNYNYKDICELKNSEMFKECDQNFNSYNLIYCLAYKTDNSNICEILSPQIVKTACIAISQKNNNYCYQYFNDENDDLSIKDREECLIEFETFNKIPVIN